MAEPILADVKILNVPGGNSSFSDSTVNLAADCNAVVAYAMNREGAGDATLATLVVNGTNGTVIDNTLSPSRTSARIGAAYATGFTTGANVTVSGTWTEANNDYIVVIIPIRDADESDPLGLFQVYAPIGTAVSPSDTFTPGTGGSLILFGLVQVGGAGSPYTLTPAGWAKLADTETGTSEFGDIDALVAYETGADPAALETFTATPTSAGGIAGIWVEIKSGAGGTNATATPSGVSGTGSIGSVQVNLDATVTLTGVEGTGSVGAVDIEATISATASPAGVEASGHVGTVSTLAGAVAAPAGVSGEGGIGSVSVTFGGTATVEGVQGSGAVGTVSVSAGANDNAAPSGVEGTGAVGTVSIALDSTATPAGVEASGEVGEVLAGSGTGAAVSGVSGSGQVGTATVTTDASVSVSGVEGAGSVGAVSIAASAIVTLSGVAATGSVGEATAFEAPAVTMGNVLVTESVVTAVTASDRKATRITATDEAA